MMHSADIALALFDLTKDADDATTRKVTERFLAYCDEHALHHQLGSIVRHLESLMGEAEKHATVRITSPYALSEKTRESLIATIGEKGAPYTEVRDESLIGGFVAEYQGRRYDASIRNQLDKLRDYVTR